MRNHRIYLQAFERVSEIHEEIASGTYPSVRRLAEKTGKSESTVKRTLDAMRERFNAPIVYERRKKGFRYSEIGWTPPVPASFDEKHLLAVFVAENALKLTGHLPEAEDLKKALVKLVSYLPEKMSFDLAILSDQMSFESPAFELSDPELRQKLAASALEQTTIEFDYYVQYRQKLERRRADVYHLHNFGGDWYAISYDHKREAIRDFHVGRISDLKTTDDYFEVRKELWNKEEYLKNHFNMLRGGRKTKVEIWFDAYQAQWIRARQPFQQNETKEDLPDGSLRLKFEIGEQALEAVARFCLQYAGHCIAEKPKKLREIIKEKLTRALEMNK